MLIHRLRHLMLVPRNPPGFDQLPRWSRFVLNMQSLGGFCCSAGGARFFLYCTVWLLAGQLFIWLADIHGGLTYGPELTLCLWAIPWLNDARRQHLHQLLDKRWPMS